MIVPTHEIYVAAFVDGSHAARELLFSDLLAAPANELEVNIVSDIAERGDLPADRADLAIAGIGDLPITRFHFEQSTMAWMATVHRETGIHPADLIFVLTARHTDSALYTTHAGLASAALSWCRAELIEL